ncbi:MAG TPA: CRISPR-associated helicase Cas3', partial [Thermoanaerobaculia bacterium]
MYYAHSASSTGGWEPLREHLGDVAATAARLAAPFGAAEEARLAGLLHDLGKYSDRFTRRLNGLESGLDHWSAGARAALDQGGLHGIAAALAIQGHHIGLQSPGSLKDLGDFARFAARHPRGLEVTETDIPLLLWRLAADRLALPRPKLSVFSREHPKAGAMLDVRMLFSALVDADFLETEAHFKRDSEGGKAYRTPGPELRPAEALGRLEEHLTRLAAESRAAAPVTALRADLLQACRAAGVSSPGLFTLSAPTGAGKTLAMLAFALHHAVAHGLRRIVVAVPFLSIIEQTVQVYRELLAPRFGDFYVLEHHSLAGTRGSEEDGQSPADQTARRLAENWDAPLVVTTSVQLLESLFANRPAACRKLHRLAGSVILLDEVQTLPPRLAVPTLAALSHLAARYGSSVVFATATQPAFARLDAQVRKLAASGWAPCEIVPSSLDLFARARRVQVEWDTEVRRSWEAIADGLAGAGTALCIVNLKRHAQRLASLLLERGAPGLFHLSTNLCPAHRERILSQVRQRLARKDPCLLVSTQCVEAGVDVDFPVVFRAFGPLDAIAQAAGRCNRNGLLPGLGTVRVFRPEDERYPAGGYQQAADATRLLLRARGPGGMDLQSPELFDLYYATLYDQTGLAAGEDQGKAKKLHHAIGLWDFVDTAAFYRLIDQDAINVLVPYDPDAFAELVAELKRAGKLTARWIRRARPHTINLYRPKENDLILHYLQPAPAGREGEESK